jgi:cell division protein FtsA
MARGRKSGTKAVVKPEPRTVTRTPNQPEQMVFALDIGTRSIIGMVGVVEEDRVKIIAIEQEEHPERAMIDGQIENIEKVAALADKLKKRLEHKIHVKLKRVCVAAAGRALRTQRADFELELPGPQLIDDEIISRLEAGAISRAEEAFEAGNNADSSRRFYLVGYTVCQYYLDQYMISSLKDHRGQQVKVDLIATFLPSEVVESLYTTMNKIDLEVASITLEPIAAINATIPSNLRLLNLVMVDIGAGTSDIAACTGGSVTGYTMATVAGDEITETIMKEYLVDFKTAETIKMNLETEEELSFKDILGFEQTVKKEDLLLCIQETAGNLCKEISSKIIEVNGGPPSALFLAGGGSKLTGLKDEITKALQMESKRVAIAGNNFQTNAFSVDYDLNNPEYATPLGIVISSGLNLINDSFRVILNGRPAKLFRSGSFTALNLLMMNGYNFQDIMGRSGQNLIVSVNGRRKVFYGTASQPASLYINKKEGKLSGIIHAGDSIDFIPAVHGVPASACLGDIEGAKDCIEITLNGLYVPLETPLKNGDVIMITLPEPPKPEPEEKEDTDIGFTPETKTESESEDRTIGEHADPVAFKNLKTVTEASALPEVSVSAEVLVPADVSDPTEISDPTEALVPTEVFGGSESSDLTDISLTAAAPFAEPAAMREPVKLLFYLNNAPLYLPQKEDKTPYYLMDMIQYSGIDLKHPKGTVTLAVNGFPGTFTQALKEGDQIRIEEELTLQTPRYNLS